MKRMEDGKERGENVSGERGVGGRTPPLVVFRKPVVNWDGVISFTIFVNLGTSIFRFSKTSISCRKSEL
jgi:hypothetical protein